MINPPAAGRASFPEIYFVKKIDNSRLVREVDSEKRRECFGQLGLGLPILLFILLFSWQHFRCVHDGYEIAQLKDERSKLEDVNRELRLEQAKLAGPERIDTLARAYFGMIPPRPQQVIQIGGADAPRQEQTESAVFARNFSAGGGENSREP